MNVIDEFTIRNIHGKNEDYDNTSNLYYRGSDTGKILEGLYLAAQYKYNDKYVLFLTEDCPFEEGLFIYLLDHALTVLDRAIISIQFTPGILGDLKIENDHEISFTFFSNDEKWTLSILQAPKRVLTHGFKVPVRRPFSLFGKRYFELSFEERIKPLL
jgi:hypothetical protein